MSFDKSSGNLTYSYKNDYSITSRLIFVMDVFKEECNAGGWEWKNQDNLCFLMPDKAKEFMEKNNMSNEIIITKNAGYYKYAINVSKIPLAYQGNLAYVGLYLEKENGLTWNDVKEKDSGNNGKNKEKGKDKSLIVKDKIKLGFNDLEESGFSVKFYDKRTILIGNVKNKENLWLDPLSSVTGQTSDGWIEGIDTTYSGARSTSSSFSMAGTYLTVGQGYSNSGSPDYIDTYKVYRTYLDFNTSSIPDNAVVTDVKLSLNVSTDSSSTDFNVSIYEFNWTEPINSTTMESNYDAVGAVYDALWRNTTGLSKIYYNSSSLNNSWINLTGDTKYQLRSDRDVNSNEPTDSEYITVKSAETVGAEPILYVTYTVDATAPVITIISPTNTTYTTTTISFNVSLSESGSWCGVSLDGAANITMTANSSNTGFGYINSTMSQGSHSVVFACNDTAGNMNASSGAKVFTIDSISPNVLIVSPANNSNSSD
ncbi:MAG: hypothetical protein AABY27_05420, partial [Pseudomonadota bacterium]